ncbi:helix-turn-helix domain-containing protein [Zhongshania aliphaticivorans]|uniref:helix-turn-helix domain-containing protein n=1 Tax=Zhongshania aliphaticivorans TaxID=1470434 RepID=UPI0012E6C269|nr:helix-turn-helix domain-containing protein [Zhongshania aliphaticivorans]CAA0101553.1 HTH-type transcriptional regulator CueR [Zhongshania aliphaticivorans]
MDIGEVAKATGLAPSTLRYYEEIGLIQSNGRKGLRRLFQPKILEELALISLGRKAGFSLDDIRGMFTPRGPEIDRGQLLEKANELDNKIAELSAIRDGLRHAAACKAANHLECPSLLRIAGKNRNRATLSKSPAKSSRS